MLLKCTAKRRVRRRVGFVRVSQGQPCSATRRLLTAVVLFAFSLQFGRFYLATAVNPHLCPEQSPIEVGEAHAGHDHHLSRQIALSDPEGGPYFEHCKDYVLGLALSPVQPMVETVTQAFPWTPLVSVALLPMLLPFPQNDLTPPFHPPRHLS